MMLPLWTRVTLLAPVLDGVADGARTSRLRAVIAHRLDADPGVGADLLAQSRAEELDQLLRLRAFPAPTRSPRRRPPCSHGRSRRSALPAASRARGRRDSSTGRTQTYRSSTCRSVTFRLRMPPPTGVVNGPLIAIWNRLIASSVSCGSQSLNAVKAFSPAKTSYQAILRLPPYACSTAASKTVRDAPRCPARCRRLR